MAFNFRCPKLVFHNLERFSTSGGDDKGWEAWDAPKVDVVTVP